MAHIVLQETSEIVEIIHDIIIHPPEKYSLEIHLDKNQAIVSLIILDCGSSLENLQRILNFFIKKYEKQEDHASIAQKFLEILEELRKMKPKIYSKNWFRFDSE